MSSSDVVSVIAPAYNHEKYIIDSLSSIAQQTYFNKELIVIDDCSKDSTASLIEAYLNRDIVHELFPAGITFIRHPVNRNAHRTLDEGIQRASGKYISIINTDDCYEPERLELMVSRLEEKHARLAFSKVRCIDDQNFHIENNTFEKMKHYLQIYPTPSFSLAIANVAIGTGNFVFDKKLYQDIGGFSFEYHYIHDWDFILRAALICEPIYVEETQYLYRFHATNTIKQISQSHENELKKDREVKAVLINFLQNLLSGDVQNPNLRDIPTIDYFFDLIPAEYCSYLWRQIREKEQYGVQY